MKINGFSSNNKDRLKELLKKYKLYQLPIDVTKLGNYLGINIYPADILIQSLKGENKYGNLRGFFNIDKAQQQKDIIIDSFQSKEYQVLVIAYLICSYLFKENSQSKYRIVYIDDEIDKEILIEAKNLLVPNDLLDRQIKKFSSSNDGEKLYLQLQEKFKVPDFVLREKIKKYGERGR